MKIALFCGGMGCGGVTINVLELGPFLMKAGHAVTIVACAKREFWSRVAETGLTGVALPIGKWENAVSHSRRLTDHFAAAGYDILFLFIGQGARPALRGLHCLPDHTAAVPVLCNDLARVYDDAKLSQHAWNVAVAVSPKVQQTAAALLPQKQIVCIFNGVRIPSGGALTHRRAWEIPLRLLFVGGLHDAHKGILRLPTILAGCRQHGLPVRLTVIGDGDDRERLEQGFVQHGVADLAEMHGAQPAEAVYHAMQTHHVLVMPSNYEGLPLVSLEAQANGCVPVASRLAGITDAAIADGVTGYLVEGDNVQEFVQHIARLLEAERWRAFSQAGIDRARQLFSAEAMGARYLEMSERITAGAYPLKESRTAITRAAFKFYRPRDYLPGALRLWLGQIRRRGRSLACRPHPTRTGG